MYVFVCVVVLVRVYEWRTTDITDHIPTTRTRHYLIDMDAVLLGFEEELTAAVQAGTRIHQVRTDVKKSLSTRARKHAHTYTHERIHRHTDTLTNIHIHMHPNNSNPYLSITQSHTHTHT